MALKRYDTVVNGVKTVLLLSAEDAERLGNTVTEVKKTKTKAAPAPANTAATPANAAASVPVTTAAPANTAATAATK